MRPRFKIFTTGEPFSVPHDTFDPVAFVVQLLGHKVGFCTDLGHATSLVKKMLEGCDYLYLEANHEPSMVHACSRPPVYKQRVLSKQGHLSNDDCAALLQNIMHPGLKHVHLAHLSSECNAQELVLKKMSAVLPHTSLSIARQDKRSREIIL
jgi:phosphoribosyl 1,2-cyclic phosphodiesterase